MVAARPPSDGTIPAALLAAGPIFQRSADGVNENLLILLHGLGDTPSALWDVLILQHRGAKKWSMTSRGARHDPACSACATCCQKHMCERHGLSNTPSPLLDVLLSLLLALSPAL